MSAIYLQLFSGSQFEVRLTVQGQLNADANILAFDANTGLKVASDKTATAITPLIRMARATDGSGNDWSASFPLIEGGISIVRTYIAPHIAGLSRLTILDRDQDSGDKSAQVATLVKPTTVLGPTASGKATLSGTTITFADGQTVDLSTLDTDTNTTNTSLALASNILTLTDSDGNTVVADISSVNTDTNTTNATLAFASNTLTLTDSAGKALTANINTELPDRLKENAEQITDWNNANKNGWYQASGAANAPTSGSAWYIGRVEAHNTSWFTQTLYAFTTDRKTDTLVYRRDCNNGSFSSWYRLRLSVDEQDAAIQSRLSQYASSSKYFCEFSTSTEFSPPPGFAKISFTKNSDATLFKNNEYVVQETGPHMFVMKVRVADNSPSTSFGVGAATTVSDGGHFSWDQTGNRERQTINYIQPLNLNKGETVKFFTYGSPTLKIESVAGWAFKI